jgi:hypothetical protein
MHLSIEVAKNQFFFKKDKQTCFLGKQYPRSSNLKTVFDLDLPEKKPIFLPFRALFNLIKSLKCQRI